MNKKKASYNITTSVLEEFKKIASKTAVNKSKLVELLICDWIECQKNKKQK